MIGCSGAVLNVTPGTNVAVPVPSGSTSNPFVIHGVLFQALPTNTGRVYVGLRGMVATAPDYVNVAAILAIPTDNFLPTFSTSLTISPNGLILTQFVIDAEVAGEGALVTWLQA